MSVKQKNYYNIHWEKSIMVATIVAILTLTWSVFDFLTNEMNAQSFFFFRLAVTVPFLILYQVTPKKTLKKIANTLISLQLVGVTILTVYLTYKSESFIKHFSPTAYILAGSPIVFRLRKKVFILISLIPLISYIVYPGTLLDYSKNSYMDVLITSASTVFLVSIIAFFFENLLKQNQILDSEISQKNEILANTVNEKDLLIKILCHDLNNLLTVSMVSLGFVDLKIKKIEIDGKVKKMLAKSIRSVELQREMINMIRDKEAIDTGKKKLENEIVPLDDIINDINFVFEDRLKDKQIKLVNNIAPEMYYLYGDKYAITHYVVSNIMSNAIKFSMPSSDIVLEVETTKDILTFIIQDFGTGIQTKNIGDLFSMNEKTSHVGTAGETGTGFGMPIVKSVMDKLKGKINIESQPGYGTKVSLIFKRAHINNNLNVA
jgi:signal transduction histidine kinase